MKRHAIFIVSVLLGGCHSPLPHIAMDSIPWKGPKTLTLDHCPNIDGTYSALPMGKKDGVLLLGMLTTPYPVNRVIKEENFNVPEDWWKIRRELMVEINIRGNTALKKEFHKSGDVYSIKTILLDPAIRPDEWSRGYEYRVGCHEGKYIYRAVFTSKSEDEDGLIARHWMEQQIEKFPDGNLKIRLWGMYANRGKEAMDDIDYTEVFPAYKK